MNLMIFELPGTSFDLNDRTELSHLRSLHKLIMSKFHTAVIAQERFEATWNDLGDVAQAFQIRAADAAAGNALRQRLEVEAPGDRWDPDRSGFIEREISRHLLIEKVRQGNRPSEYQDAEMLSQAETFVVSLQTVRLAVIAIGKIANLKSHSETAKDKIDASIPDLVRVRDSIAHIDERVRGLARNRPINVKPVSIPGSIDAAEGVLITSSIMDWDYTCTVDNGEVGKVPIRLETLVPIHEALQALIGKLPWKGPPTISPS